MPAVFLLVAVHQRHGQVADHLARGRDNLDFLGEALLQREHLLRRLGLARRLVDDRHDHLDLAEGLLEVGAVVVLLVRVLHDLAQQQRVLADALHGLDQVRLEREVARLGYVVGAVVEDLFEVVVGRVQFVEQAAGCHVVAAVHRVDLEVLVQPHKHLAQLHHDRRALALLHEDVGQLLVNREQLRQVGEQRGHVALGEDVGLAQTLHVHVHHDLKVLDVVDLRVDELVHGVLPVHLGLAQLGQVHRAADACFVPALALHLRVGLRHRDVVQRLLAARVLYDRLGALVLVVRRARAAVLRLARVRTEAATHEVAVRRLEVRLRVTHERRGADPARHFGRVEKRGPGFLQRRHGSGGRLEHVENLLLALLALLRPRQEHLHRRLDLRQPRRHLLERLGHLLHHLAHLDRERLVDELDVLQLGVDRRDRLGHAPGHGVVHRLARDHVALDRGRRRHWRPALAVERGGRE
eukprot:Unigene2097_Nuclearia_a/m.6516 Unigene2097_Nuclearia_a/g.6516  ORF Unigene2097_Nuclearia_a/g.6516 Unigene2097_Nuclearia_a/m.6516 type:complete len:467 (-) Unigene2097_Nuclearia_a:91-1491(-)